MKVAQITVQTNKGEQMVDAYLHGKFAVQRFNPDSTAEPQDALWSVTHIATGLAVTSIWGRAPARKFAKMLDAEIQHDITKADYEGKTDDWLRFKNAIRPLVGRD